MAANRQQGAYVGTSLVGLTSFAAGMVSHGEHAVMGSLIAVIGVALLVYSLLGFYRIKKLEFTK